MYVKGKKGVCFGSRVLTTLEITILKEYKGVLIVEDMWFRHILEGFLRSLIFGVFKKKLLLYNFTTNVYRSYKHFMYNKERNSHSFE